MPSIISTVEMRSNIAGTVSGSSACSVVCLACSSASFCSSAASPRAAARRQASPTRWTGSANDMDRNITQVWKRRGRNGSSSPDKPTADDWKIILESTVHAVPATSPTRKTAVDRASHVHPSLIPQPERRTATPRRGDNRRPRKFNFLVSLQVLWY